MTRRNITKLFFAIVCTAFVAIACTAVIREWGSPLVFVSVENDTSSRLRSVTLTYETCGLEKSLTIQELPSGKTYTFKFPVCGEGDVRVSAKLQDGRMLVSRGDYVESSWSVSEQVEQTGIRSDTTWYHL
jgi:hypothetical protein